MSFTVVFKFHLCNHEAMFIRKTCKTEIAEPSQKDIYLALGIKSRPGRTVKSFA